MTTTFTPEASLRKLPVGIQSFEDLRRQDYLYVDKTAFVYEIVTRGKPYFLSRSRRFGKSLLLSTFKTYFEGKRELFEGLAIEQLETEWAPHAVLHLSLNSEDYSELEGLIAEDNDLTHDECMERFTCMYDGYRFTTALREGIYNPFSIPNVLDLEEFRDYWFASGTPTFLIEMLCKTNYDLRHLDGIEVSAASLTDDRANPANPVPMIYQSGYLTIKDYDKELRLYTLGFPNEEVKYGFLNFVVLPKKPLHR